jgi:hypothetical protein
MEVPGPHAEDWKRVMGKQSAKAGRWARATAIQVPQAEGKEMAVGTWLLQARERKETQRVGGP